MPGMPFTIPGAPMPWQVNNQQLLQSRFDMMPREQLEAFLASGQGNEMEDRAANMALERKTQEKVDSMRPALPGLAAGAAMAAGDDEDTPAPAPVVPVESQPLPPPRAMRGRSYIEDILNKPAGDQDKWLALAQAGAAMAASPSKYPLQAIGQGALTGFNAFRQSQSEAARNKMLAVGQLLAAERDDENARSNRERERLTGAGQTETERSNRAREGLQKEQIASINEYRNAVLGQGNWDVKGKDPETGFAILVNSKTGETKTTDFDPAKLNSSSIERIVDKLQKDDPEMSYEDALQLANGTTNKRALADNRILQQNAESMRKFVEGFYKRNQLVPGRPLNDAQKKIFEQEKKEFAATLPKPLGAANRRVVSEEESAPEPEDKEDAFNQARQAISRGADRKAVEDRLRKMGYDPKGL